MRNTSTVHAYAMMTSAGSNADDHDWRIRLAERLLRNGDECDNSGSCAGSNSVIEYNGAELPGRTPTRTRTFANTSDLLTNRSARRCAHPTPMSPPAWDGTTPPRPRLRSRPSPTSFRRTRGRAGRAISRQGRARRTHSIRRGSRASFICNGTGRA